MIEKEFLDKILDQTIEEASTIYVEKQLDKENESDKEIKFSDIHNEKMKEVFKKAKRKDFKVKAIRVSKKVAIVLIGVIAITGILVTSVEAWRKEVVKFIMKNNQDNYMSIKFGNPEDEVDDYYSGDTEFSENTNQYITDEIKFLYLPEGFKYIKDEESKYFNYWNFKNNEQFIYLKKDLLGNISKEADIEKTYNERIEFEDKEVFKIVKNDGRVIFVWYDEKNTYTVASTISEQETLKFIENIKILKNF